MGMLTWGRLRTYEGGEYRKSTNILFNTVVDLKLLKKKSPIEKEKEKRTQDNITMSSTAERRSEEGGDIIKHGSISSSLSWPPGQLPPELYYMATW